MQILHFCFSSKIVKWEVLWFVNSSGDKRREKYICLNIRILLSKNAMCKILFSKFKLLFNENCKRVRENKILDFRLSWELIYLSIWIFKYFLFDLYWNIKKKSDLKYLILLKYFLTLFSNELYLCIHVLFYLQYINKFNALCIIRQIVSW